MLLVELGSRLRAMSAEATIREATVDDIALIRRLAEATWWPTYSSILEGDQIRFMLDGMYAVEVLSRLMSEGSQQFLLLVNERGAQGFAAFGAKPETPHVYKLHKLYIHPTNQKRGYGKQLVGEVTRRLRELDGEALELNVNCRNPARSFYEALGFKIVREEQVVFGPYRVNDYVMQLRL